MFTQRFVQTHKILCKCRIMNENVFFKKVLATSFSAITKLFFSVENKGLSIYQRGMDILFSSHTL